MFSDLAEDDLEPLTVKKKCVVKMHANICIDSVCSV